MHPEVFREFDRICRDRRAGGRVLEIGAVPTPDSLLNLEALRGAREKLGLNLEGPFSCSDYVILQGNANHMTCFRDGEFDTLLCNAVLEHDKFFWRTLSEMRRVARSRALIVIGAPGFTDQAALKGLAWARHLPGLGRYIASRAASTRTLRPHEGPGDFYRFSVQAFREVFFAELAEVEIQVLLSPPRIIGSGIKP